MTTIALRLTVLLVLVTTASSGCSVVNVYGEPFPGTEPASYRTYYVERAENDERGLQRSIADGLAEMGVTVTSGERGAAPDGTDAIVQYSDRWMWDMRMYLLQLDIYVRDARTGYVTATGQSFRTSLAAKDAKGMTKEIFAKILHDGARK